MIVPLWLTSLIVGSIVTTGQAVVAAGDGSAYVEYAAGGTFLLVSSALIRQVLKGAQTERQVAIEILERAAIAERELRVSFEHQLADAVRRIRELEQQ